MCGKISDDASRPSCLLRWKGRALHKDRVIPSSACPYGRRMPITALAYAAHTLLPGLRNLNGSREKRLSVWLGRPGFEARKGTATLPALLV